MQVAPYDREEDPRPFKRPRMAPRASLKRPREPEGEACDPNTRPLQQVKWSQLPLEVRIANYYRKVNVPLREAHFERRAREHWDLAHFAN